MSAASPLASSEGGRVDPEGGERRAQVATTLFRDLFVPGMCSVAASRTLLARERTRSLLFLAAPSGKNLFLVVNKRVFSGVLPTGTAARTGGPLGVDSPH